MNKEEFVPQRGKEGGCSCLSKKELAMMYAPDLSLQGARKRFMSWLHMNTELMTALYEHHYRDNQRIFTARQVEIIFSYLGEPLSCPEKR